MTSNDNEDDEQSGIFNPGKTVAVPGDSTQDTTAQTDSQPKYRDRNWLQQQLVELNRDVDEIADECGVTPTTIHRWKREFDIEIPRKYRDKEWMYQQIVVLKREADEIAELCDGTEETINKWRRKFDLPSQLPQGPWGDEEWLEKQYVEMEKSAREIADEQGCSRHTIHDWLVRHGIERRDRAAALALAHSPDKKYADEEWLRKQYKQKDKTQQEIAELCDVSQTTIDNWLKKHGIETPTHTERSLRRYEKEVEVQPDKESGAQTDSETVTQTAGQKTYSGPEDGIDAAFSTDLAETNTTTTTSPYREEDWLREKYDETHSAVEMAEMCDVSPSTILAWMERCGIDRDKESVQNPDAPYKDEDWLHENFDGFGSIGEMAEMCDVERDTISEWMKRFGIERPLERKSIDDLIEAVIKISEDLGGWVNQATYEEHRKQIDYAPEKGWFYEHGPDEYETWDDVLAEARQRYDGEMKRLEKIKREQEKQERIDNLIDAVIKLSEETGGWISLGEYRERRKSLDNAPSADIVYNGSVDVYDGWDDVLAEARQRYDGTMKSAREVRKEKEHRERLDQLVDKVVELSKADGEWVSKAEYQRRRKELDDAPSPSVVYSDVIDEYEGWNDVLEEARRRYSGDSLPS